jgi:hypothetical protein
LLFRLNASDCGPDRNGHRSEDPAEPEACDSTSAHPAFLGELPAQAEMPNFRLGERVCFQPDNGPPLCGVLARYKRKSVTVITDEGQRWNVAPVLLRRPNSCRAQ